MWHTDALVLRMDKNSNQSGAIKISVVTTIPGGEEGRGNLRLLSL